MKEESKGVKFFKNVGFYGSLACIPTTIFIGPVIAFPLAIGFLGVTATAVTLDIERKRTLPPKQEENTSSVSEIVREFKRLNNATDSSFSYDSTSIPTPIEEAIEIQNEIDELSSIQFITKRKKEQELENKQHEAMEEWEKIMSDIFSDIENGEE